MEENGKKRKKIIMVVSAAVCLCLAAGAAAYWLLKNPLAKGLMNLVKEIQASEAETGEPFLMDTINRIGSGNVRTEYSLNVGGISKLPNITFGLDGEVKRDMGESTFAMEGDVSIANTKLAKASLFGTEDLLYLQAPAVWDGSVVFEAENISGQWNDSSLKAGLALLMGQDLTLAHRIDGKLFQTFSIGSSSAESFLEKHKKDLKELYMNMVVLNIKKALEKNLLSETQAAELEGYILKDEAGEQIKMTCYFVKLPAKELVPFFGDNAVDIILFVYLDSGKRIVRITTVPEGMLETKYAKGEIAINLTGKEATIDRMEVEFSGTAGNTSGFSILPGEAETEGRIIIEKESDTVILEIGKFALKLQNKTLCRVNGKLSFSPLTEKLQMPLGKQYRINEMDQLETMFFLAECAKNVSDHFGGYLKIFGL